MNRGAQGPDRESNSKSMRPRPAAACFFAVPPKQLVLAASGRRKPTRPKNHWGLWTNQGAQKTQESLSGSTSICVEYATVKRPCFQGKPLPKALTCLNRSVWAGLLAADRRGPAAQDAKKCGAHRHRTENIPRVSFSSPIATPAPCRRRRGRRRGSGRQRAAAPGRRYNGRPQRF